MKRKTMIVPAVFMLVLCLAFAAAEEVSGFTGKWVTVALTSLDSPEWNLPIPAQWNAEMPALEMAEDGTARWIVGQASQTGTWTSGAEAGKILLSMSGNAAQPIVLKAEKGHLSCETEIQGIGNVQLSFGREEAAEIVGKWSPVLQTYGEGEYWSSFPRAITAEFKANGTGIYTENSGTGKKSRRDFTWRRQGNDVIASVQASLPDGAAGEFPFAFFQLDQGLLKQYDLRGGEEYVLLLYGQEGSAAKYSAITSADSLLNTAWELDAIEVHGLRIPLSMLGMKAEEYLAFSRSGDGRLFHLEEDDLNQVKFTCRIEKGTLHLIVSEHDPIPCRWAGEGYLVRETKDGQKLYYRRKWMPEAPGITED
ncbi:MAG: hypothetical protein IKE25_11735 [Clostridia bacterium]|nr:hypothetical protein [Clostridia bacterium]